MNSAEERHKQILDELERHLLRKAEPREMPSTMLAVVRVELERMRNVIPKDNEIREVTDELRKVAVTYHASQQLRAQISKVVLRLRKPIRD